MEKHCQSCDRMLTDPHAIYCSRKCYWDARGRRGDSTCGMCGRKFRATRKDQKHCSRECYGSSKRNRPSPLKGRNTRMRECPQCHKGFPVGGRGNAGAKRIYCSRACAAASRRVDRGECKCCGKPITGRTGVRRRSFCSHPCYIAYKKKFSEGGTLYTCRSCGKKFRSFPSRKRCKRTYCSRECYHANRIYKTGPDHPQWKGGTFVSKSGYIMERDGTKRLANGRFMYRSVHARIAEEKLGRPLKKNEHVHHLDCNKLNNDPANLMVLPDWLHRKLHHFYSSAYQQEHAAKGDLEALTKQYLSQFRRKKAV